MITVLISSLLYYGAICAIAVNAFRIRLPEGISDRCWVYFYEIMARSSFRYMGPIILVTLGDRWLVWWMRISTRMIFRMAPSRKPVWMTVTEERIAGVPCRVHIPDVTHRKSDAVILHVHGGGWVIFEPLFYDGMLFDLNERLGVVIVSVDYRLAPEAKYNASILDLEAVAHAIRDERLKAYGVDPHKLVVMGDSAGGNLAAVLAQRALRQGTSLYKCQVLTYPVTQFTLLTPSYRYSNDHYAGSGMLSPIDMAAFFLWYAGLPVTANNLKAVTHNRHISTRIRNDPKIMELIDPVHIPPETYRNGECKCVRSQFVEPPDEELAAQFESFILDPDRMPIVGRDLSGMAPALIQSCGIDVLRDDSALYVKQLKRYNVETEWKHYDRGFHAITLLKDSAMRHQMLDDIADFVRRHVATA